MVIISLYLGLQKFE